MSDESAVPQEVEDLINEIITRNNLTPNCQVHYGPGSQEGDGFIARTIAVEIKCDKTTLHLFVKCAPDIKAFVNGPAFDALLFNEVYFYRDVHPTFRKFLEDRGVENYVLNVPECHGTYSNSTVAMENLKTKGFTLFDKSRLMNDDHISLVLKSFAKFHAISYAMKDQEKETYDRLTAKMTDLFSSGPIGESHLKKGIVDSTSEFLRKLDPLEDKVILDKCQNLSDDLTSCFLSAEISLDEYSIITQGDCWCNNMMFLYKDQSHTIPSDMKMIDWQILRLASPVFDLSYFFYTIAAKESLNKLKDYLKLYHDELSERIRKLGSDPDVLYPYEVLWNEWKKFCRSGVAIAFMVIRMVLLTKEELHEILQRSNEEIQMDSLQWKKDQEYMQRMKDIVEHIYIDNDFV